MKKALATIKITKSMIEDMKRDLFLTDPELSLNDLSFKKLNQYYCDLTYIDTLHDLHNSALDKRQFALAWQYAAKIDSELEILNNWMEAQ